MLTIMILMAVFSTAIEMMIVMRWPGAMHFFEKYQTAGLVFSVIISFVLGFLFGMSGMIVGGAAVISTGLSAVIYNTGMIPFARALPGHLRAGRDSIVKTWHEFQAIIHVTWVVVTFPVRLVVGVLRVLNRLASIFQPKSV